MNTEQNEQGAFNGALYYLETITSIEREIDLTFLEKDYNKLDTLLDILWMELAEWVTKEPQQKTKHEQLREQQKQAYQEITKEIKKGRKNIPQKLIEPYIDRYIQLKVLFHQKGLRMAKKENILELMKAND